MRLLCGLGCTLALSAMLVARADDAVTKLAQTYKEGDTARYKQVIKVNAAGMDVTVTTVDKSTVKEIKKSGDIVILREEESNVLNMNGADQNQENAPKATLTFSPSDRLLDMQPAPEGGIMEPGVAKLVIVMHHFIFPDKAVKSGDTWENEVDDPAVKDKKLTIKGTFLGTEKREGKDLWKIKQAGEPLVDAAGGKMTFEFTGLFDPANGQLIHAEGNVKQIPTQYGNLDWTEETSLVKPDAEKKP
jgi:hypothetical protein